MFKECNIKGFATEKKYLNLTSYDSMYYFNLVIICDEKFNDSRKVIKVNP